MIPAIILSILAVMSFLGWLEDSADNRCLCLWYLWKRWRIYCPKYRVDHLFEQNTRFELTPYGLVQFPGPDNFRYSLFDWREAFVSPCLFNERWCGGVVGKWTPKIKLMGGMHVEG